MAEKFVIDEAFVSIKNSQTGSSHVDVSENVTQVAYEFTAAELDATNMKSEGHMERLAGLKDGSLEITFQQNFENTGDAQIYQVLKDENGKMIELKIRPTQDPVGATNPELTVPVIVSRLPILGGTVGEIFTFTVTWNFAKKPEVAIT